MPGHAIGTAGQTDAPKTIMVEGCSGAKDKRDSAIECDWHDPCMKAGAVTGGRMVF